jgi:hypothetical protein
MEDAFKRVELCWCEWKGRKNKVFAGLEVIDKHGLDPGK